MNSLIIYPVSNLHVVEKYKKTTSLNSKYIVKINWYQEMPTSFLKLLSSLFCGFEHFKDTTILQKTVIEIQFRSLEYQKNSVMLFRFKIHHFSIDYLRGKHFLLRTNWILRAICRIISINLFIISFPYYPKNTIWVIIKLTEY